METLLLVHYKGNKQKKKKKIRPTYLSYFFLNVLWETHIFFCSLNRFYSNDFVCDQVNPFKDQIMKVFSTSGDGLTFEDMLDMMSVMSEHAPKNVKVEYAFRIYGKLF